MVKSIIATGMLLLLISCGTTGGVAKGPVVLEDFEHPKDSWIVFPWQGNTAQEVVLTEGFEGSDHALMVNFSLDGTKSAQFGTEQHDQINWSGTTLVTADLLNSSEGSVQVSLAISTGDNWTWYETTEITLEPGEQIMGEFYLDEQMKSESSGWKYTTSAMGLHKVMRIAFSINGEPGITGAVLVDNIKLHQ